MFVIFIISAAAAVFFLQWSRKAIQQTVYSVESERLPAEFDGFRVVQVSDLQSEYFGREQKNLLKKVRMAQPDIIVFTGDLPDRNHTDYQASLTAVRGLAQIAPVYYVNGNHELALPQEEISQMYDAMKKAGVHLLLDSAVEIVREKSVLCLAGLSEETVYESKIRGKLAAADRGGAACGGNPACGGADCGSTGFDGNVCDREACGGTACGGNTACDSADCGSTGFDGNVCDREACGGTAFDGAEAAPVSGRKKISDTDIDASFLADTVKRLTECGRTERSFSILLVHEPQFFKTYAQGQPELIFAGHAHGGQIRLPFTQGLFAPGQGVLPSLTSGLHTCGGTAMIISRGLGNSTFPIRLFNRPEIVSVKLVKKKAE